MDLYDPFGIINIFFFCGTGGEDHHVQWISVLKVRETSFFVKMSQTADLSLASNILLVGTVILFTLIIVPCLCGGCSFIRHVYSTISAYVSWQRFYRSKVFVLAVIALVVLLILMNVTVYTLRGSRQTDRIPLGFFLAFSLGGLLLVFPTRLENQQLSSILCTWPCSSANSQDTQKVDALPQGKNIAS
jgi:hypothetical protein